MRFIRRKSDGFLVKNYPHLRAGQYHYLPFNECWELVDTTRFARHPAGHGFTLDGHTLFPEDVLKHLNRAVQLEIDAHRNQGAPLPELHDFTLVMHAEHPQYVQQGHTLSDDAVLMQLNRGAFLEVDALLARQRAQPPSSFTPSAQSWL